MVVAAGKARCRAATADRTLPTCIVRSIYRMWPAPDWRRCSPFRRLSSCGAAFHSASAMRCRDLLATSSSSTATVVRVATLVGHLAPLLAPFLPGPAAYLLVDEALRHRQIAKIARRQHR